MRLSYLAVIALGMASPASAQQYKLEKLSDGPPAVLGAGIKGSLSPGGYRVVDPDGKPFADLWLRAGIPASGKPSGPKGAVLYPVLAVGELLGLVKFSAEAHDYRDQTVPPGVYTLRYGLQPINGDHLGVSVNRDYILMTPAAKDADVADVPKEKLEKQSAESAGANHPTVLLLLAPPADQPEGPAMVNDMMLNTWGAILPLPLAVPGEAKPVTLPVQLVVVGSKTD